ncbi:MAG: RNA pyrophosphohydrolase [Prosthecobacter sp.]|nr:RNA pyrophosphohydrolase [Prosthecobacter sp.]
MEVNDRIKESHGLILPGQPIVYRPNVAAILQNQAGDIFMAERLNIKGAWQFPQGGIDDGEDAETAMFREVAEEIGVAREMMQIIKRRDGYRYSFPKGRLKYGIYGGQEQAYFLCQFLGQDSDVNLAATHQEFARWRWLKPHEFQMDWVPKFKRAVYRQVFLDFFQIDFALPTM